MRKQDVLDFLIFVITPYLIQYTFVVLFADDLFFGGHLKILLDFGNSFIDEEIGISDFLFGIIACSLSPVGLFR